MTLADQRQAALALQPGREHQFKLVRLQTYNWGTFDKLREIPIARAGHLFLGPSGSGKSTLLDGHTSLLTPPIWVDFNTAARSSEKGAGDRSLATYVRGAWATQKDDDGERVKKYLRMGSTWSALSELYQDAAGRTVVIGRILWIRGNSSADADVHRLNFVVERDFNLRELEFFKDEGAGFEVRRLKAKLNDVHFTDEFGAYQTRFMRIFKIASSRALRLLHKTQSAKDLGDLNKFLREFMLDPPATFEVAETLVSEFQVLNSAHDAVLTARNQIEALRPVQTDLKQHELSAQRLSLFAEEKLGLDYWREQLRSGLLHVRLEHLQVTGNGLADRISGAEGKVANERGTFDALLEMRAGAGGSLIAHLQSQVDAAERVRLPEVTRNQSLLSTSCQGLDAPLPQSPEAFAELQAMALNVFDDRESLTDRHEKLLDDLKGKKRGLDERFTELLKEIRSMQNRTSNLPSKLLEFRERMCHELNLREDDLPFVGELLQVKSKESRWAGAIERVLGGFSRDMLVEEIHYADVAAWIDRTHLGTRLGYRRIADRASKDPVAQLAANSLVRKLDVADRHQRWLTDELRRFDYACVDTIDELRRLERGVTLAGQVKHNRSLHEKDDSRRIDDRNQWVLGFTNAEKLKAYEDEFHSLRPQVDEVNAELDAAREAQRIALRRVEHSQTIVNLTWENSNVIAVLQLIRSLNERVKQEKAARPHLSELEKKVDEQRKLWDDAVEALNRARGELDSVAKEKVKAERQLSEIHPEQLSFPLSPTQRDRLNARLELAGKQVTVDNLDATSNSIERAIGEEVNAENKKSAEVKQRIEHNLYLFCNRWPAEAQGLDPRLESALDFMSKLARLETDGLHEYVSRFRSLLREQSDQNLAVLHARLEQERREIGERLDQVNQSLRRCAFNEDTYLVIDSRESPTQEVTEFRAQLRTALNHSFKDEEDDEMERRFSALNAVVQRLGSQQPADMKWRKLVLDVRQHVTFSATEFDSTGIEVETYDSGAGKSGGQRQKLTTTVLAAALRYQLAGEEGVWPTYSTVVMDEAFDRADNEFTAMVMNIFNSFGFQVIAATPVKNVMALEPFIGGGTFVSIRDRKHSEALPITYLHDTGRLDLPLEAQDELAEEAITGEGAEAE